MNTETFPVGGQSSNQAVIVAVIERMEANFHASLREVTWVDELSELVHKKSPRAESPTGVKRSLDAETSKSKKLTSNGKGKMPQDQGAEIPEPAESEALVRQRPSLGEEYTADIGRTGTTEWLIYRRLCSNDSDDEEASSHKVEVSEDTKGLLTSA